jgi:hypothetical protein
MAGIVATLVNNLYPEYEGERKVDRYTLSNGQPTIVPGAQTGGTVTGASAAFLGNPSDVAGQFQIVIGSVSGSLPAGGGTMAVITLANTLNGSATPLISPANPLTATLFQGTSAPDAVGGSSSFSIVAGSVAASGTYLFNYNLGNPGVTVLLQSKYMLSPEEVIGADMISATFNNSGLATTVLSPNFTNSFLEVRGKR